MKTRIFTLIALMACTTVLFSGCKKGIEKKNFLKDTTWVGTIDDESFKLTSTIVFGKDTFDMKDEQKSNFGTPEAPNWKSDSYPASGSYSYDSPIVTLDIDGEDVIYEGTVTEDTITIEDMVYKKQ